MENYCINQACCFCYVTLSLKILLALYFLPFVVKFLNLVFEIAHHLALCYLVNNYM